VSFKNVCLIAPTKPGTIGRTGVSNSEKCWPNSEENEYALGKRDISLLLTK
jgi:hypothetical protein